MYTLTLLSFIAYDCAMDAVLSFYPSSTIIYSKSLKEDAKTLSIASAKYSSRLYDVVKTLNKGIS